MSKITIQDIANMCNVSKSSVSRYLNGGYIGEENKEKIKKAIEKTGFETNFFAKRLKSKKSNLIGVVVPRLDSITVGKVLMGLNQTAEDNGYTIIIQTSNLDVKKETNSIKSLYSQGVDGIIVYTVGITKEHIQLDEKIKIPIVFLNQENEYVNFINIDDYKAGNIMAKYFYENKHKNIVFLGVNEKDKAVGIARKKGFYDYYKENAKDYNINFIETDFSFKKAYSLGEEILKFNPTGVVCATDNICLGAMLYFNEKNIKIPNQISIAGFGGYDVGQAMKPSITTIKFDYELLGKKSTENIINMIDGKSFDKKIEIPLDLVIGDSVCSI